MEERLLENFEYFCKYKCKYRNNEEEKVIKYVNFDDVCDNCGNYILLTEEVKIDCLPCETCQIQEFIRITRDNY